MQCGDPRVITANAAAKSFNMAATAGPSQLTNHKVAAVTRLPGGHKLLANWAGLWLRVSVCDVTVKLWTSVRMVALDEGWAKPGPG